MQTTPNAIITNKSVAIPVLPFWVLNEYDTGNLILNWVLFNQALLGATNQLYATSMAYGDSPNILAFREMIEQFEGRWMDHISDYMFKIGAFSDNPEVYFGENTKTPTQDQLDMAFYILRQMFTPEVQAQKTTPETIEMQDNIKRMIVEQIKLLTPDPTK